jgi:SAM-dependent methyltransferase
VNALIWHDVECGSYDADLSIWEDLAAGACGPIVDLGCGSGRVALHLGRRGHDVVGLDTELDLIEALLDRADGLPVRGVLGDARAFELDTDIALALAPMQLIQLLPNRRDRHECIACAAAHILPNGRIALAIVEEMPAAVAGAAPVPDVREVDGWVYSSLPLETFLEGPEIVIRRLRQTVSPAGALSEEENEVRLCRLDAEELEADGASLGLTPFGRLHIPATDLHVGSTVVVLGRED